MTNGPQMLFGEYLGQMSCKCIGLVRTCRDYMKKAGFSITFPEPNAGIKTQSEEYCVVESDGQERKIRLHDYHEIYALPGLYEHLFYERLKCKSPDVITRLLIEQINKSSAPISELVVFDLGAGSQKS